MLCDTELPIWINRLTFYLAFIPLMNIFCPRKLNELVQRHRKIRAIERKIVNGSLNFCFTLAMLIFFQLFSISKKSFKMIFLPFWMIIIQSFCLLICLF